MVRTFVCTMGVLVGLLAFCRGQPSSLKMGGPASSPIVLLTTPSPYWGYTRNPYASTLHGLADLTRAQGHYLVLKEKASLQREKTRQEKLTTRQRELEQFKWKQNFLWELRQEEIERTIQAELRRSIHRPATSEIVAGSALNRLYDHLKKQGPSAANESQAIQQVWLDHVNFTSTGGNPGLLRQRSLSWPILLQEDRFSDSRERIEHLLDQARTDAKAGKVTLDTVKGLLLECKHLDEGATESLQAKGSLWGPTHHILANRFLKQLKDALMSMQNPQEAAFLLGQPPQSKNVAELVQYMRENGLRFAPAFTGSERHYISLHDALAQAAQRFESSQ